MESLPAPARAFAEESAQAAHCDPTYFVLPMLAVLAASIGTTRRIRLKAQWLEPSIVWTVVMGRSGTQKSAGHELAIEPLAAMQSEAMRRYESERESFQLLQMKYDAELSKWKHKQAGEPPTRPIEPQPERLLVRDATVESLAPISRANPRGILVARDELSGWFKGFDAYKQGRGGDSAHWLEFFHGRELTVDRKSGDSRTIYVPRASVSVTGTIQPGILERILGPEQFESGLSARLLLSWPDPPPKRWSETDVRTETVDGYAHLVRSLLGLAHREDSAGELAPVDLGLTDAAKVEFVELYNRHGAMQRELADEELGAAFSKLEGYAARFALILHCCDCVLSDTRDRAESSVSASSIRAGVSIADWFAYETARIYGAMRTISREPGTLTLVEVIRAKGGTMSVRDLQRANQSKYPTAESAKAALDQVKLAGYGSWVSIKTGGRPIDLLKLHDASDSDTCPDGATA